MRRFNVSCHVMLVSITRKTVKTIIGRLQSILSHWSLDASLQYHWLHWSVFARSSLWRTLLFYVPCWICVLLYCEWGPCVYLSHAGFKVFVSGIICTCVDCTIIFYKTIYMTTIKHVQSTIVLLLIMLQCVSVRWHCPS